MVWHLQFSLSLASNLLYLIDHKSYKRVCWTSTSLRIPGALHWHVLGVSWHPFHNIHRFFSGGSAHSFLGVIRNAYLVCPWRSLALFISEFKAIPGRLDQLSPSQGDPLCPDISMALQTNLSLFLESLFGQGFFLTLFVDFIGELMRLSKVLTKLISIDFTDIVLSFDF